MENQAKSYKIRSDYLRFEERFVPQAFLNKANLPQVTVVNYLDLHLDSRLTWKTHILMKRNQLQFDSVSLCGKCHWKTKFLTIKLS